MLLRPEAIELRRVRLPLVAPFRAAHGTQHDRAVVLVRAMADGVEGWGECAAFEAPSYTAEYVDGALDVLRRWLVPAALGGEGGEGVDSAVAGHPMAKAALSSALVDLSLRASGESLSSWLGGVRSRVPVGVALGLDASVDDVADALAEGYHRVKLKVAPGVDVAWARAAFPDAVLAVDANGSYSLDQLDQLRALDGLGLAMIEQPLPAADLVGHASVARSLSTPVCLDESISSAGDASSALALGACSVVNVKPGRVGGLQAAKAVHDVCAAAGVPVWCGGMLETGVGRAAALAVAALPGCTMPADLSASARYYAEDLTEPFELGPDGCLAVPDGPGIGVTPLPDVLAARTEWSELVRP